MICAASTCRSLGYKKPKRITPEAYARRFRGFTYTVGKFVKAILLFMYYYSPAMTTNDDIKERIIQNIIRIETKKVMEKPEKIRIVLENYIAKF